MNSTTLAVGTPSTVITTALLFLVFCGCRAKHGESLVIAMEMDRSPVGFSYRVTIPSSVGKTEQFVQKVAVAQTECGPGARLTVSGYGNRSLSIVPHCKSGQVYYIARCNFPFVLKVLREDESVAMSTEVDVGEDEFLIPFESHQTDQPSLMSDRPDSPE